MAEKTKEQQRVEQLEAENEQLRGQLAAAGANRPANAAAPAKPFLTEASRLEAEQLGYASVGGVVYTAAELREMFPGVPIADAAQQQQDDAARVIAALRKDPDTGQRSQGIRGVTHVWPSVAPGRIDPAVAGTPGINGPSA